MSMTVKQLRAYLFEQDDDAIVKVNTFNNQWDGEALPLEFVPKGIADKTYAPEGSLYIDLGQS